MYIHVTEEGTRYDTR